ncbi:hypothetical protein FBU30_002592, partial [Linnemannia zychae]
MIRKSRRPPISSPFKRTRTSEQQDEAKKKIKAWRSTVLGVLEGQSEIYDERCIMDEGAINLISARFGEVSTAKDINSIVDWSELLPGSQQVLTNILVAYNNEIDGLKSKDMHNHDQED